MSAARSLKRRAPPARYPGKVFVLECVLWFKLACKLDDGTELPMTTTRATLEEAEYAARRIESAWNYYQTRRTRIPTSRQPHARSRRRR